MTLTGSLVTRRPANSLVGRSGVSFGLTTATVGGSGGGNCGSPDPHPAASPSPVARMREAGRREQCIGGSGRRGYRDMGYASVSPSGRRLAGGSRADYRNPPDTNHVSPVIQPA